MQLFALMASVGGETAWERLVSWYQDSLFHELITYFSDRYFSVEFEVYENFSLGSDAGVTARNMILAIMFGIIVAAFLTAYTRNVPGGFVRKLLAVEALSPESAKTLSELGYFRSTMIRWELSRGSALRMVVRCRELEKQAENISADGTAIAKGKSKKAEKATKIDFLTAHFYIPEELRYRADVRFDKNGSGWRPAIGVALVAIIVAAVLCWFLPDIVRLADNLITIFAP